MATDIPKTNNRMYDDIVNQLDQWYPLKPKNLPSSILEGVAGVGAGAMAYGIANPSAIFQSSLKNLEVAVPPEQPVVRKFWDAVVKENKIGYVKPLALTLVWAPLFEELLFRGELFLKDSIKRHPENEKIYDEPEKSLLDSAIDIAKNVALFTVAHFDPRMGLKGSAKVMLPVAAVGATCAAMAEATDHLLGSTATHTAYNALVMNNTYRTAKLYCAKKPI